MTRTRDPRTDLHRPGLAVLADYDYVGVFYQGSSEDVADSYGRDTIDAEEALEAGPRHHGNHERKGTCDHCGARFAHGVVYRHRPTGELVAVGHICAQDFGDPRLISTEMKKRRKALDELKSQRRTVGRALLWLAKQDGTTDQPDYAYELDPYWASEDRCYAVDYLIAHPDDHFLADVLTKFRRYGSLSYRQVGAILRSPATAGARAERAEAREAERAAMIPCPEGRVEIEGEVVKTDWQDNDFGGRAVMTVKDDRGFLVWGTLPDALGGHGTQAPAGDWHLEVASYPGTFQSNDRYATEAEAQAAADLRNVARAVPGEPTIAVQGVEYVWVEGAQAGSRVKFTATVTRSDRDESFGFYKRPSKAEIIEQEEA